MPLHAGHVALVEFARAQVDVLFVCLGARHDDPIPGATRMRWLQDTFPYAQVVRVSDDLPSKPEDDPAFWPKWREALSAATPGVTHVFTSERYGERLAHELGAESVVFDLARSTVPVSATQIRQDHVATWDLIASAAKPWFLRRIAVVGGESTGKSTLAAELASALKTVHVPEYGREHMVGRSLASFCISDAEEIATRQAELEEAARSKARGFLVADTEAITTAVWTELAAVPVPSAVWQADQTAPFDLYLLCEPDLPWEQDGTREFAGERDWFRSRLVAHLTRLGRPFVSVTGLGSERLSAALAHLEHARHRWFGELKAWRD